MPDWWRRPAREEVRELALFPLQAVLFPGGHLELKVFEARYLDMVADCLRHDRPFGVCLLKAGEEVGQAAVPEEVGTLAWIRASDMAEPGILRLRVEGGQRFVVESTRVVAQQLLLARVRPKPDEAPVPIGPEHEAGRRLLVALASKYPELGLTPVRDEASWLGFRLAEVLPLPLSSRQALLEMNDSHARLDILLKFMALYRLA